MTPEQIKNHIGEVWGEWLDGKFRGYWRLDYVGDKFVVVKSMLTGSEYTFSIGELLDTGYLPQGLRKKPRMVKAPGWVVWHTNNLNSIGSPNMFTTEKVARDFAEYAREGWNNVAIQAPGSDEMEVVKGF